MPNYCSNEVTIEGSPEVIAQLLAFVKSANDGKECEFDFSKVVPYPDGMTDEHKDAYDWRIENWGTKWNACDPSIMEDDGNKVEFSFDTAWSPSLPVSQALSAKFPTLMITHKYEEGGLDFSGYAIFSEGMTVNQEEGTYNDFPLYEHQEDIIAGP